MDYYSQSSRGCIVECISMRMRILKNSYNLAVPFSAVGSTKKDATKNIYAKINKNNRE